MRIGKKKEDKGIKSARNKKKHLENATREESRAVKSEPRGSDSLPLIPIVSLPWATLARAFSI